MRATSTPVSAHPALSSAITAYVIPKASPKIQGKSNPGVSRKDLARSQQAAQLPPPFREIPKASAPVGSDEFAIFSIMIEEREDSGKWWRWDPKDVLVNGAGTIRIEADARTIGAWTCEWLSPEPGLAGTYLRMSPSEELVFARCTTN